MRRTLPPDLCTLSHTPDDSMPLLRQTGRYRTNLLAVPARFHYAHEVNFLRSLSLPLLYRRTVKTLASIDARLAEQNLYLKRLADHFAPHIDEQEPAVAQAGVDYLNHVEAILVQDYQDRTFRDTGKLPTDDEILRYLADEATTDLQSRMQAEDR